jgi:hypothetical protein
MNTPLLWHIPLSLYSEKVRWALDYKGIAHRRQVTVKRKPARANANTRTPKPRQSRLSYRSSANRRHCDAATDKVAASLLSLSQNTKGDIRYPRLIVRINGLPVVATPS